MGVSSFPDGSGSFCLGCIERVSFIVTKLFEYGSPLGNCTDVPLVFETEFLAIVFLLQLFLTTFRRHTTP